MKLETCTGTTRDLENIEKLGKVEIEGLRFEKWEISEISDTYLKLKEVAKNLLGLLSISALNTR